MEIEMIDFTDAILLASALALGLIPTFRSLLRDRNRNAAAFRDYFGPEYDRDLLRQSTLSETEEWRADDDSRLPSFRTRYLEGRERN
jgi:hypothetical protein